MQTFDIFLVINLNKESIYLQYETPWRSYDISPLRCISGHFLLRKTWILFKRKVIGSLCDEFFQSSITMAS